MPDGAEYRTATRAMLRRRLQAMDPADFEQFVADLWTHLGWQTRVVGAPGDRGIDVVATHPNTEGRQLIQAKRYGPSTTVGSPEVQQYASLRLQEDDVEKVFVVTTGEFSGQAEQLAPDLDVLLVDGAQLLDMALELDAADLVAEHLDDVELRSDVERAENPTDHTDEGGPFATLKGWFGL